MKTFILQLKIPRTIFVMLTFLVCVMPFGEVWGQSNPYRLPYLTGTVTITSSQHNYERNPDNTACCAIDMQGTDKTLVAPRAGKIVKVTDDNTETCNPTINDCPHDDFPLNEIWIEHENSDGTYEYSLFWHIAHESTLIDVGYEVDEGQTVASEGDVGRATGSHLHYELREHKNGNGSKVTTANLTPSKTKAKALPKFKTEENPNGVELTKDDVHTPPIIPTQNLTISFPSMKRRYISFNDIEVNGITPESFLFDFSYNLLNHKINFVAASSSF